jgi:hypothetical protein
MKRELLDARNEFIRTRGQNFQGCEAAGLYGLPEFSAAKFDSQASTKLGTGLRYVSPISSCSMQIREITVK